MNPYLFHTMHTLSLPRLAGRWRLCWCGKGLPVVRCVCTVPQAISSLISIACGLVSLFVTLAAVQDFMLVGVVVVVVGAWSRCYLL